MKNVTLAVFFGLAVFGCSNNRKESPQSTNTEERKYIPAFTDEQKELSVSDLKLNSKEDTISYALGIAWARGLGRVGINKVSYAFYLGVHDYLTQNKTFTTTAQAAERIDKEVDVLKNDSTHTMDPSKKLGDISRSSKYETLSYVWAFSWTRGVKEIGITKLTPALMYGLTRGLSGDNSLFDYASADKYLRAYVDELRVASFHDIKDNNEQWLADNKTKKDVVTLPSGLQYRIIKQGEGKSPQAADVIVCHYTAKLIDGRQFESTYDQGTPMKAYPSGVIPAWREALPKMKVGSVWELYVPYSLGYGSGGVKDKVPPFATLIYKIELLDVEKGS